MNYKKLISGAVAGAMAMSMCAVSAFAATIELDSEYVGAWGAGKCIPKADLEAVGGDVRIVLTIETRNLANTADQFLIRPMDYDNGWTDMTPEITSDFEVAKADGMICIPENDTTVEFVLNGSAIAGMGDSGLGFQVQNVIIKSAEIEAGSPQGELTRVAEDDGVDYCFGRKTFEELTGGAAAEDAPAEETEAAPEETEDAAPAETAPASDSTTTSSKTGNASAMAIAFVMVGGLAAAVISRKK